MQLLRVEEANAAVARIEDPVTRELVRAALALVFSRFIRWKDGQDTRRMPVAPFDALFFVSAMTEFFTAPQRVRRMLDGESLGEFGDL